MKLDIIARYIIYNYFLLTALAGFGNMLGIGILLKLDLILLLSGLYIFFSSSIKKMQKIDILLLLFLLCISISSALNNYSSDLLYYGLRYQILLTIFFFIGKSEWFADWKFFDKMQIPIITVSLIGLYLYLVQPSWYMVWKLQSTTEFSSESRILEMTRLSAFWQYPYWVSYGCALLYHYKLYMMFMGSVRKQDVLIIFFLFLIVVLTQQRAPLLFIVLSTVFFYIYSFCSKSKYQYKKFRRALNISIIVLFIAVLYVLFNILDEDRIVFMINKIVSVDSNNTSFLNERLGLYKDFQNIPVKFWGDGIGRYSHLAYQQNKLAITDCQYIQTLHETGYFGFIGYIIIFVYLIINGVKNIKLNIFEIGVSVFYLIAMIGANPLSNQGIHTVFFWICCGRMINNNCLRYKQNEYEKSNCN
ncbi:O-antigen ligase family protein [Parabacteroides sp. APC149_11_2_Y6]